MKDKLDIENIKICKLFEKRNHAIINSQPVKISKGIVEDYGAYLRDTALENTTA